MANFQLLFEAYLPLIVEIFLTVAGIVFVVGGAKVQSPGGSDGISGKPRPILGILLRIFGYFLIIAMSLLIFLQFAHSSC
jgi:hypothetical protein